MLVTHTGRSGSGKAVRRRFSGNQTACAPRELRSLGALLFQNVKQTQNSRCKQAGKNASQQVPKELHRQTSFDGGLPIPLSQEEVYARRTWLAMGLFEGTIYHRSSAAVSVSVRNACAYRSLCGRFARAIWARMSRLAYTSTRPDGRQRYDELYLQRFRPHIFL